MSDARLISVEVLETEKAGLDALIAAISSDELPLAVAIKDAVDTIFSAKGRTIVTGMGKSGHVARKIAATLASTGTSALYVHPGEASHGDLGMIEDEDVVIALSNSGETPETFKPYGVGYVELPGGVRVEGRLTENDPDKLEIGMEMELYIDVLNEDDEHEYTVWKWRPAGAGAGE